MSEIPNWLLAVIGGFALFGLRIFLWDIIKAIFRR